MQRALWERRGLVDRKLLEEVGGGEGGGESQVLTGPHRCAVRYEVPLRFPALLSSPFEDTRHQKHLDLKRPHTNSAKQSELSEFDADAAARTQQGD